MAHADDGDGQQPAMQLLDERIPSDEHAAAYAVLVDTLSAPGGKKSHAIDRVDIPAARVREMYETMDEEGLVDQQGERRGATYRVMPGAERVRDEIDARYPGWSDELTPFWRAAYHHGIAEDLMPHVDSGAKEDAVTALVAGIAATDASMAEIATVPDIGYSSVNDLRGTLEERGFLRSEGAGAATTYRLTGQGRERLLPVVMDAGVDYTAMPFAETDWDRAYPADTDAWIEDIMASDDAAGDPVADPEQIWAAALATVHAERTGRPLGETVDRYDVDVADPAALRAAVERDVLPGMLADAGRTGRALRDAVGDLDAADERPTVPAETLSDLADGLPDMGAGKRTVLAYLGEHGDAARDDLFDVLDIDNRSIGQSVRYLRNDGLVAEEDDGTVTLTDAGERVYRDPDPDHVPVRGSGTAPDRSAELSDGEDAAGAGTDRADAIDVPLLADIVAELRKGNTLQDAVDATGTSYPTVKSVYSTAERLGYVDHAGPNWNRNYSVDDAALAGDGFLREVERRSAPELLDHGAEQAASIAWFANVYDRANHRFRECWDADELPEDLIIPQWQELLAVARASAHHDGTLDDAALWLDSTPSALVDHLDRFPDGTIELHRPDEETNKKDRQVLIDPEFRSTFDRFADRLTFDPDAVTYQGEQSEDEGFELPESVRDDGDGSADDPQGWTDFSNRDR